MGKFEVWMFYAEIVLPDNLENPIERWESHAIRCQGNEGYTYFGIRGRLVPGRHGIDLFRLWLGEVVAEMSRLKLSTGFADKCKDRIPRNIQSPRSDGSRF